MKRPIALMLVVAAALLACGSSSLQAGAATDAVSSPTAIDLGTLGGRESWAVAVNDAGLVVGRSYTTRDAAIHAFSWTRATGMTDLGTLGGCCSVAVAVNDAARPPTCSRKPCPAPPTTTKSAQVVGYSNTTGDASTHAFSWTVSGGMTDLGTLGGNFSFASAVNNAGQVVGDRPKPAMSTSTPSRGHGRGALSISARSAARKARLSQ